MKNFIFLLSVSVLFGCKPEQLPTEFEFTVKPLAGKTVETSTQEDEPVLVTYEVTDEDATDLSFDLVEPPKYGKLKDCEYLSKRKWQCVYVPFTNFTGKDSIAFKNKNGDFVADEKSIIMINVLPVPDAPVAGGNQKFSLMENTQITFNISKISDPDTAMKDMIIEIKTQPSHGQLKNCFTTSNKAQCTFIPTAEYYGEDFFEYSVSDEESHGLFAKSSARVDFNIMREWIPVNGVSQLRIEDKPSNALIVFAIDTSSSMNPYIDHMKKSVSNFIDDITNRGFKATVAFITSDQVAGLSYKDVKKVTKPHPNFPNREDSWLEVTKRVPTEQAVKIFEINAYDAAWNEETKNNIANQKTEIDAFLSGLPQGVDDERLICSTLRFLNSDFIDGKDFVGVFTLSNEEDAFQAGSIANAMAQCHKEKRKERTPIASCQEVVSCEEGDPDCNGEFTYKYTKVTQNPYPAVYQGKCIEKQPNYVEVVDYTRKYKLKEIKATYKEVIKEDLIEYAYERTKVVENPKKANRRGTRVLPKLDKRKGKKEVEKIAYRKGLKYKEVIAARTVVRDLPKITKRKGSIQVPLTPYREGYKWRKKHNRRSGTAYLPETAMRRGVRIKPKTEYRRGKYKLPTEQRRRGEKVVSQNGSQKEHCHEDWVSLDNVYGCKTVNTNIVDEGASCPSEVPSTTWISCETYTASKVGNAYEEVPEVPGYIASDEITQKGKCSDVKWIECNPVYKATIDGKVKEFGADELALENEPGEAGTCPTLPNANWQSCTNYWTVVVDGATVELATEEDFRTKPFTNESGTCSARSNVHECVDFKAVLVNNKYIPVNEATDEQLVNWQRLQKNACPSEIPNTIWKSCTTKYRYTVDGKHSYTENPSYIALQSFDELGSCPPREEVHACDEYYQVNVDGQLVTLDGPNDYRTETILEEGSCAGNTDRSCTDLQAVKNGNQLIPVASATDEQKTFNVAEELGECNEEYLSCENFHKATIDGKLQVVDSDVPAFQVMSLEDGKCSDVSWEVCTDHIFVLIDGNLVEIQPGEDKTENVSTIGKACDSYTDSAWATCETYYTVVEDGKKREVAENEETRLTIVEEGKCSDLEEGQYISCTQKDTLVDDGKRMEFDKFVETGAISDLISEAGRCSDLPEEKLMWLSGECSESQSPRLVQQGTKDVQVACEATGGSSCSDHTNFVSGTCSLKTPAGFNEPTLTPNQTKKLAVRMSCEEATGYDTCSEISYSGTKQITKSEGCALKTSNLTSHGFEIEGAEVQSLSNTLAHELNNSFTKSVYVSVINDLELNQAALTRASSENIPLPSDACNLYQTRREMFKQTRDGQTVYPVDGVEFMNVVSQMGEQASAHSICSPDRYPSDKLDFLVADATLNYKVPEYEMYDLLKVSAVRLIYASGESKNLEANEYVYEDGHVTIVDPVTARNLVEIQMSYDGFEK